MNVFHNVAIEAKHEICPICGNPISDYWYTFHGSKGDYKICLDCDDTSMNTLIAKLGDDFVSLDTIYPDEKNNAVIEGTAVVLDGDEEKIRDELPEKSSV